MLVFFVLVLHWYIIYVSVLFCVRLLSQHDISLTQALQDDPLFCDLLEKISHSAALQEKLAERTSSLQVLFTCVSVSAVVRSRSLAKSTYPGEFLCLNR